MYLPNGFNELIKTDEDCTRIVNIQPITIAIYPVSFKKLFFFLSLNNENSYRNLHIQIHQEDQNSLLFAIP